MLSSARFILSAILLFCFGCWERQDIELLRPEIPHYTLSGYTIDIDDSTLILPKIPISISAVQMLYDVTFDPITIESDSNGYFNIDTVYPGNYIISAKRDGYTVVSETITVGHEDKVYDVELPKLLFSYMYYRSLGSDNPLITGVSNGFWFLGRIKIYSPLEMMVPAFFHYVVGNGTFGWDKWYKSPSDRIDSMEYTNGLMYIYYTRPRGYAWLDAYNMTIIDSGYVNDPLSDFVWDGSGFWSTYGRYLQYRGRNIESVENSWKVNSGNLGSLTKLGDYFYIYDLGRDLILETDPVGKIHASYRPIDYDTGLWIIVYDMDFGYDGNLWVSDKLQKRLYIFQVE